jgi:hypothetical protein
VTELDEEVELREAPDGGGLAAISSMVEEVAVFGGVGVDLKPSTTSQDVDGVLRYGRGSQPLRTWRRVALLTSGRGRRRAKDCRKEMVPGSGT